MTKPGFATRLEAALDTKGRGYTNVQFARELTAALEGTGRAVANTTVTEWLKGRSEPPLYVIEAIGRVLDVDPRVLAFGEPAPPRHRQESAGYQQDAYGARIIPPEEGARPATRPPERAQPAAKRPKRAG